MSLWYCKKCESLTGPEGRACPKCGGPVEYATLAQPTTPASAPEVSDFARKAVARIEDGYDFEYMPGKTVKIPMCGEHMLAAIEHAINAATTSLRDELRRAQQEHVEMLNEAVKVEEERNQLRTQLAEAKDDHEKWAREMVESKDKLLLEMAGLIQQLTALQAQHDREGEAAKVEIAELRKWIEDNKRAQESVAKSLGADPTDIGDYSILARPADFADKIMVSRAEWEARRAEITRQIEQVTVLTAALAEAEKERQRHIGVIRDAFLANQNVHYYTLPKVVQDIIDEQAALLRSEIKLIDAALAQQASSEGKK